eukprot:282493-Chlamydomonas_euryale.AAC.8
MRTTKHIRVYARLRPSGRSTRRSHKLPRLQVAWFAPAAAAGAARPGAARWMSGGASGGGGGADGSDGRGAARAALSDPMSRLMASRGMPLGFSANAIAVERNASGGATAEPTDGNGDGDAALAPPRPEPGYQMEAIDEIFQRRSPGDGDA